MACSMKKPLFATVVFIALVASGSAGQPPDHAKILGIRDVRISCGRDCAATSFYSKLFPLSGDCWDCGSPPETPFYVNDGQQIFLTKINPPADSYVTEIVFATDNLKLLQRNVEERGLQVAFERDSLRIVDPEGHQIRFVQPLEKRLRYSHANHGMRIIHAGFVVNDREAMDKFYRDVLGFHVYWHGGMKDGKTDWVDMQVPDGTDWIEYMLNVPANADKHALGVMNHIALGVPDVRAAAEQLKKNGVKLTEEPKIGRDGKWQLNLYDPDQTRVELMEYTPAEKPCCAEYTGAHPKP
jgi:catechol 2,3-dioxygenase-like lactoylglutathione lyase family enzyme